MERVRDGGSSMDIVSQVPPIEGPEVNEISQVEVNRPEDATAPAGISTMAELREKAPPLYKAIMESLAYRICTEQNRSNERIKRILDEGGRNKK